jgi:glycosyltransferase involved in cell wall biosynthesis
MAETGAETGAALPRLRAIHLIPYDGIGGVEEAARSMARQTDPQADPQIDFHLRHIFPDVRSQGGRRATYDPRPMWRAAREIATEARRAAQPTVLIASLWRSSIVGILVRMMNPRVRLVTFIHNSVDAHLADRLFTRLAIRLSVAVWADSAASVRLRFARPLRPPVTVISYLLRRLDPLPPPPDPAAAPVFAFWGRLAAQKNLGRALRLFARIRQNAPQARFRIIGPDGGEEAMLRQRARDLGLGTAVEFLGPLPFDQIPAAVAGASFYLQTSRHEGAAIAVTEAMQLGLIPLVTPVGDIARYCQAGHNAILLPVPDTDTDTDTGDDAALAALAAVLHDPAALHAQRSAAIATWAGREIYAEAVFRALRAFL